MRHNLKVIGTACGILAIINIIAWAVTGNHTLMISWIVLIVMAFACFVAILITAK